MHRSQLGLGLRFEYRFGDLQADGCNDRGADIVGVVIFVKEFTDGFNDGFAEGLQVGAALWGELAVDKGIVFFAVLFGAVGEGTFEIILLDMDDGVECAAVAVQVKVQKVKQPV